jgi:hypothetical protein
VERSLPSNSKSFIGIDNGVSGNVTILSNTGEIIIHVNTPVKNCLNYTKKKAFLNRVDFHKMRSILNLAGNNTFCLIERPLVNPMRWNASVSALRCLEATLILLENLQIPYQYIDSKEWQKALLPAGLKGDQLKTGADQVAKRLYPKATIVNSDALLIAHYCRMKNK